ncbi:hypothetical protein V1478_004552 [Vespula squamosa]|uniref:Uncharacterized protein n=1 Tax=Vespula squamosa TaxID=30214 RepID=A0ABD2BGV9_VESSQ
MIIKYPYALVVILVKYALSVQPHFLILRKYLETYNRRYLVSKEKRNIKETYYNDRSLSKATILFLECLYSQFISFEFNFKNTIMLLKRFNSFLKNYMKTITTCT